MGIIGIAIAVLDSMKYMRPTHQPRDWLQKNRQAGIGVAGDIEETPQSSKPATFLPQLAPSWLHMETPHARCKNVPAAWRQLETN
jgi:hypothetical protein